MVVLKPEVENNSFISKTKRCYGSDKKNKSDYNHRKGSCLKRASQNSRAFYERGRLFLKKSDSYISHIETGRLDFPDCDILEKLLRAYGVSVQEFKEKLRVYKARTLKEKRIENFIKKLSNERLNFLMEVLEKRRFYVFNL